MSKYYLAIFFMLLSFSVTAQPKIKWADQLDQLIVEKDINKKKYLAFEIAKGIEQTWRSKDIEAIGVMSDKISTLKINTDISVVAFATEMPVGNLHVEWLVKDENTGDEEIWNFKNDVQIKPGTYNGLLKLDYKEGADKESYLFTISSGKVTAFKVEDLITKCLFERLYAQELDSAKDSINQELLKRMHALWSNPSLFESEFIGLERVKTIISEDKKVKVSTYGLVKNGFKNEFYGAVVTNVKGDVTVFDLQDTSDEIRSPERASLNEKKWFGALYIDLIQTTYKKKTYYTLLGYKGQDEFVKTRVIDVLSISNNRLRFGSPIFKMGRYTNNRLIFMYSVDATMLMRYDSKAKIIVMDNLAPSEQFYRGVFRFYGPDFSYNGLEFTKGVWQLHEEIDIRNPKPVK